LPFINDTEENTNGILNYCVEAKVHAVLCFGMGVTLRDGDRQYFYKKLDEHFPGMKERYIKKYGYSYVVGNDNNSKLMNIVNETCKKNGILTGPDKIFEYLQEFPDKSCTDQLSFF